MKEITEKQIIEWKAELDVQKQKKTQAEQVLDEITRAILMILKEKNILKLTKLQKKLT